MQKKFVRTWAENIKSRKLDWFADQIMFYKTYEQLNTSVKIEHLSNEFIDWEFLILTHHMLKKRFLVAFVVLHHETPTNY